MKARSKKTGMTGQPSEEKLREGRIISTRRSPAPR